MLEATTRPRGASAIESPTAAGDRSTPSHRGFAAGQLLWVRRFAKVPEPVEALGEFEREYNERWRIRRHGHRTPSQGKSGAT